jgi:hypothetical protein
MLRQKRGKSSTDDCIRVAQKRNRDHSAVNLKCSKMYFYAIAAIAVSRVIVTKAPEWSYSEGQREMLQGTQVLKEDKHSKALIEGPQYITKAAHCQVEDELSTQRMADAHSDFRKIALRATLKRNRRREIGASLPCIELLHQDREEERGY